MNKLLLISTLLLLSVANTFAQTTTPTTTPQIKWMTWDEAVAQGKKDAKPKKIFIDFYTDWCGWCKKMDATTFANPTIVEFMNANYYAVKFDAEGMDTIVFNNNTFINSNPTVPKAGGRGHVHILAYSLLEGQLSYPSYTILDENFTRLHIIQGYKQIDQMLGILLFFAGEEFKYYHNYMHGQWQRTLEMQKQAAGGK